MDEDEKIQCLQNLISKLCKNKSIEQQLRIRIEFNKILDKKIKGINNEKT